MRVIYGFFSIIKNSTGFPPRNFPAVNKTPLSVAIITRDAATQIGACLASVRFADDVVVVDSGSRDDTVAIAEASGARVTRAPWRGFGPQKQLAVKSAKHDWVLCVDADERVTPELANSIAGAIAAAAATGAPVCPAYRMARCNRFLGRWLRHGEGYPDWSVRLFDRRAARWSDDAVHERVIHDGAAATLSGDLMHESAESLAQYLDKQNTYTTLQAQKLFANGGGLALPRLVASPLLRFFKFYFFRLGFLDGWPGLVHIAIGCMNSFMKYAKVLELRLGTGIRK
jgi:glycosyltransferase involved in cell wall biosynthesis